MLNSKFLNETLGGGDGRNPEVGETRCDERNDSRSLGKDEVAIERTVEWCSVIQEDCKCGDVAPNEDLCARDI